jgi:hypothetical protein
MMRDPRHPSAKLVLPEPEIVRAFNSATDRPPWSRLPEAERVDHLRRLAKPLVDLAASGVEDPKLCRRMLVLAVRHGQRRRDQGFTDDILVQDVHYFGAAVLTQFTTRYPEALPGPFVTRLEHLLSLICLASLRGYHRETFERQGRWPGVLADLGPRGGPFTGRGLRAGG